MCSNHEDLREKRRFDFLMGMYSELWGNVNRHLTVIWQSVGVLGAGLALFALTEKNVVGVDFATGAMIVICFWLMANAYVASEWFNRNQAIISNVERQFLYLQDEKEINPFFLKPRDAGKMESHIRVQWLLGAALAIAVLVRHLFVEVVPTFRFSLNIDDLDWNKTVPYLALLGGVVAVWKIRSDGLAAERKFRDDCPGKDRQNIPASGTAASGDAPTAPKTAPDKMD